MSGAEAAKPIVTIADEAPSERPVVSNSTEPSMDEILASIRKIISDQTQEADEAAAKAAQNVANPQIDRVDSVIGNVENHHWQDNDIEATGPDFDATFDASEIGSPTEAPDEISLEIPELSITPLEPVISSLEDFIEPALQKNAPEPASASPEILPEKPVAEEGTAIDRYLARRSADISPIGETLTPETVLSRSPDKIPDGIDDALQLELANQMAEVTAAMSADSSPVQQNGVSAHSIHPVRLPSSVGFNPLQNSALNKAPAHRSPPLLSEQANSRVSDNFERLALSMLSERKTEMDDMMVEIMRPMLQSWLENNLPSLVEKLVREEIERVSRGTHRQR